MCPLMIFVLKGLILRNGIYLGTVFTLLVTGLDGIVWVLEVLTMLFILVFKLLRLVKGLFSISLILLSRGYEYSNGIHYYTNPFLWTLKLWPTIGVFSLFSFPAPFAAAESVYLDLD